MSSLLVLAFALLSAHPNLAMTSWAINTSTHRGIRLTAIYRPAQRGPAQRVRHLFLYPIPHPSLSSAKERRHLHRNCGRAWSVQPLAEDEKERRVSIAARVRVHRLLGRCFSALLPFPPRADNDCLRRDASRSRTL
ncbi:hypothetical protein FB451DRAFT_1290348, partial [Mycena latifolia]